MKRLSVLCASLVAVFVWQACSKKDDGLSTPLPKADFTFDMPGAGLLPTVVNFTSTSTNATAYQWTFDDGNTATTATASNTYTTAKTYNVKLVVTGPGGKDSITKAVTITQNKPVPNFTFTIQNNGSLPDSVIFTNTTAGGGTYLWSFDNGDTSTKTNPVEVYTAAKTYNVKLIAFNMAGKDSVTKQVVLTLNKPKANFSFVIANSGANPTTVNFTNTSTGMGNTYAWTFGNGDVSTSASPSENYTTSGTFNIRLIATNAAGADTITQQVPITINKPKASFTYTVTNPYNLPLNIACNNTSTGGTTYTFNYGDGSASTTSTTHTYTAGGIYTIKLVASSSVGSDSTTQTIKVSPYLQAYTSFDGKSYNLYTWEGSTVALLMRTANLDPTTMFKWVRVMDSAYSYYYSATGQFPSLYTNVTYLNNHVTIADVATTCGAGCGYLGTTGIEMQNTYTDRMYQYALQTQYDQELFYECGRNYWYYGNQLAYKTADPTATGFAIFMRFMAMDATGVSPAPFNSTNWTTFRTAYEGLVDTYVANTSNTWANTLGIGVGVTNSLGLGASDLWASFLSRLVKTYGTGFVLKVWKAAAQQPTAVTTQDAVDNFILSCCAAANKNLTTLFMTTWRWPMSSAAITAASKYPS